MPLRLFAASAAVGLCALTALFFITQSQDLSLIELTGDSKAYQLLAHNVLEHGAFSLSKEAPYAPESFRAPGYPLFLASLLSMLGSFGAVLVAQALIVSVAPGLLYLLIEPYHKSAAWWGSVVFMLEPTRLFLSSSLLSDALFSCLLLGSLVFLDRASRHGSWRFMALAGVALGLAILVRPVAMFLPLLYVVYVALSVRPWRQTLCMGAIFLVAVGMFVSPWIARNYALFGSIQISAVGSANLMLYNAPEFVRAYPSERGAALVEQFRARQESLPQEEVLSLSRAEEFTSAFREVVAGQELAYAFFHIAKTVPFFITDGLRDMVRLLGVELGASPNYTSALLRGEWLLFAQYVVQGGLATALLVVGSAFWAAVACLWALTSGRALLGRVDRAWLFFAALVLYFALLTGPVSNARYRLPVEGFLLAGATVSVLALRRNAEQKRI